MSNCLYKFNEKLYTKEELKELWDDYVIKEEFSQRNLGELLVRKSEIEEMLLEEVTDENIDLQIDLQIELEEINKQLEGNQEIKEENTYEHQEQVKNDIFNWLTQSKTQNIGSLTGKPGTGKTYLLGQLTGELLDQGYNVVLASVTNDAVGQLKKVTAKSLIKPTTLGSAFRKKYDIENDEFVNSNEQSELSTADVIIIDEGSMITQEDLDELMKLTKAKILFSSDPYQSTGMNEGLSPIYNISNTKNFKLTERVRQKEGSSIMEFNDQLIEAIDSREPLLLENLIEKYDENQDGGIKLETDLNDSIDSFLDEYEEGKNTRVITFNNENNDHPLSVKNLINFIYKKLDREPYEFIEGDQIKFYASISNTEGKVINNNQEAIIENVELKDVEFDITTSNNEVDTVQMKAQILTLVTKDGKSLGETMVPLNKENFYKQIETLPERKQNLVKAKVANIHPNWVLTVDRSQGATYESAYVIADNILKEDKETTSKELRHLNVAVTRASNKTVIISDRVNPENKDKNYAEEPDFSIMENPISNSSLREIGLKSNTDKSSKSEFITPAEAIIPSKFIDAEGNEVDIREKLSDGNFKYFYESETEEGQKYLNIRPEMIEDRLLNLVSYRIPTSAHNSMLSLKIVGFSDTADQIIVGRNAMVPSGFDYDIDKQTVFNLVQTVNNDGKLVVKNSDEINSEQDLMDAEINNLHNMMSSVLNHNNTQNLTQKALSFERITKTSNVVNSISNEISSVNNLSTKLRYIQEGNGGKMGTGVHSIAARVAHVIQGYNESNKNKITYGVDQIMFGDFEADGNTEISSMKPRVSKSMNKKVDLITTIADANTQNQNNSLDNANNGNMIKRNENSDTINFYVGFANAGFTDVEVNGEIYDYPTLLLGNNIIYNEFFYKESLNKNLKFKDIYKIKMRKHFKYIPSKEYKSIPITTLNKMLDPKNLEGNTSFLTGNYLINNVNKKDLVDNQEMIFYELAKIQEIGEIISATGRYINGNYLDKNGTFDTWISKFSKESILEKVPSELKNYFSAIPNLEKERILENIIPKIDEVYIRKQLNIYNINIADSKKPLKLTDIKAYMISHLTSLLGNESLSDFRERMISDKNGNQPFINYIESIKNYPSVIGNSMLAKMQSRTIKNIGYVGIYDKVKDLMPTVDEESQDFKILYEKNKSLPDFNGQSYDTQQLALDLFKYGLFIQGGVAGQASINRIISKDLFFITGVSDKLRSMMIAFSKKSDSEIFTILNKIDTQKNTKPFSPIYRNFDSNVDHDINLNLQTLDNHIDNIEKLIPFSDFSQEKEIIKTLLTHYDNFIKKAGNKNIRFYSSKESKVNVNTNEIYLKDIYNPDQIIHELVHVITHNSLRNNNEVYRRLESLRNRLLKSDYVTKEQRKLVNTIIEEGGVNNDIKKRKDKRLLYALTNVEDMLSVFFEKDPIFMELVNNVDDYSGNTFLDRLVNALYAMINSFAKKIFGQTFDSDTYAYNIASNFVLLTQRNNLEKMFELKQQKHLDSFASILNNLTGRGDTTLELVSLLKDKNVIC